MPKGLSGKRVAIVATDGVEQVELTSPKRALEGHGVKVDVIAPKSGHIRAWKRTEWGERVAVDHAIDEARTDDYDALVLPGGVMNPDKLRRDERVLTFVRRFFDENKPVAVICHGPWTLIDAGVIKGRKLTSYPSLQLDLQNAGAEWVDEEVVVDRGLVSSRHPDDIPAFNKKMIEEFAEGRH